MSVIITPEDIYREYGVCSHHWLFASSLLTAIVPSLISFHSNGAPFPNQSIEENQYEKFRKMLQIGIPEPVVAAQLKSSGLDPSVLCLQEPRSSMTDLMSAIRGGECQLITRDQQPGYSKDDRFIAMLQRRWDLCECEAGRPSPIDCIMKRRVSIAGSDSESDTETHE